MVITPPGPVRNCCRVRIALPWPTRPRRAAADAVLGLPATRRRQTCAAQQQTSRAAAALLQHSPRALLACPRRVGDGRSSARGALRWCCWCNAICPARQMRQLAGVLTSASGGASHGSNSDALASSQLLPMLPSATGAPLSASSMCLVSVWSLVGSVDARPGAVTSAIWHFSDGPGAVCVRVKVV